MAKEINPAAHEQARKAIIKIAKSGASTCIRRLVLSLYAGAFFDGDGDLFDDVSCSVAQQPRRTSHGADSGQAGEQPGGTPLVTVLASTCGCICMLKLRFFGQLV